MKSDSYLKIMKVSLFHGIVQMIQLVFTIARGKIAAVLLGPHGVGILNLFTSTLDIFSKLTTTGFCTGALPLFSKHASANDSDSFRHTEIVFLRLLSLTGAIGGVILFIAAPILSKQSFGTDQYTHGFQLLSLVVFTNGLYAGMFAIVTAQRHVWKIATITLLNSIAALLFATTFYYFMKSEGIVPAIVTTSITTSFTSFLITLIITKHRKTDRIRVSWKETFSAMPPLVRSGLVLTAAATCGSAVTYILNQTISHVGSIADIGLFQTSMTISTLVSGVVLSAVGTDYLPRISAIQDQATLSESVSRQAEIVTAVSLPISTGLILFAPIVVPILLSKEFLPIVPVIRLTALATLLKAFTYVLGFIPISRRDNTFFFYLEGIFYNVISLGLNIFFYMNYGIVGLGISYMMTFIISTIVSHGVASIRYGVRLSRSLYISMTIGMTLSIALFSIILSAKEELPVIGIVLFILSIIYSSYELNQKVNIIEIVQSKFNKITGKVKN